jgi:hypothetical protein
MEHGRGFRRRDLTALQAAVDLPSPQNLHGNADATPRPSMKRPLFEGC